MNAIEKAYIDGVKRAQAAFPPGMLQTLLAQLFARYGRGGLPAPVQQRSVPGATTQVSQPRPASAAPAQVPATTPVNVASPAPEQPPVAGNVMQPAAPQNIPDILPTPSPASITPEMQPPSAPSPTQAPEPALPAPTQRTGIFVGGKEWQRPTATGAPDLLPGQVYIPGRGVQDLPGARDRRLTDLESMGQQVDSGTPLTPEQEARKDNIYTAIDQRRQVYSDPREAQRRSRAVNGEALARSVSGAYNPSSYGVKAPTLSRGSTGLASNNLGPSRLSGPRPI